jgi:hypothetical protein
VLFIAGDHVPVIPFVEEIGKVNVPPTQMDAIGVNVGVAGGPTFTVSDAIVAHCPAAGVNVYVVVAVLFIAGDHVPVIPFVEEVGKVNVPPTQMGAIGLNVGVVDGFTVTASVVMLAHCPAAGVKVYVVVAELFIAGDQVPVIPFVEVVGSVNVPPEQICAIGSNVGVTDGLTVTASVAVVAH